MFKPNGCVFNNAILLIENKTCPRASHDTGKVYNASRYSFSLVYKSPSQSKCLNYIYILGKCLKYTVTSLFRSQKKAKRLCVYGVHYINEPHHAKTNILHMRKQRRRSASQ